MRKLPPLSLSHNHDVIIVVCLRHLPKVNQNSKRPWVRVKSSEAITTVKNLNWEWLCELRVSGLKNTSGYCLSLAAGYPQTKKKFRVRT